MRHGTANVPHRRPKYLLSVFLRNAAAQSTTTVPNSAWVPVLVFLWVGFSRSFAARNAVRPVPPPASFIYFSSITTVSDHHCKDVHLGLPTSSRLPQQEVIRRCQVRHAHILAVVADLLPGPQRHHSEQHHLGQLRCILKRTRCFGLSFRRIH